MSEKITCTFRFYGNAKAKKFESDLIQRFKKDLEKDNDAYSAVRRLVFKSKDAEGFETYARIGAYGSHYFGSEENFEIECQTCAPEGLHDELTRQAAKSDPDVVVQMDFIGNTPNLVGSRFAALGADGEMIVGMSQDELNCHFCDEADVESLRSELVSDGEEDPEIMSYQELDALWDLQRDLAGHVFERHGGTVPPEFEAYDASVGLSLFDGFADSVRDAGGDAQVEPTETEIFRLDRTYLKGVVLNVPDAPAIFLANAAPGVEAEYEVSIVSQAQELYEVTVTAQVRARAGDTLFYTLEVRQAGLFEVRAESNEKFQYLLGVSAPAALFPHLAALVSDLVSRTGLPELHLPQVQFRIEE